MCGLVFGSGFVIMSFALSNLTIMGGSRKFRQGAGVPDNDGRTNLPREAIGHMSSNFFWRGSAPVHFIYLEANWDRLNSQTTNYCMNCISLTHFITKIRTFLLSKCSLPNRLTGQTLLSQLLGNIGLKSLKT